MRTSIPILTATLALTVFLTSLVLETRHSNVSRANIRVGGLDTVPADPTFALRDLPPADAATAAAPVAVADGASVEKLVEQAGRFVNAGNLDGAAELLRAALQAAPSHPKALETLGAICFARREYPEAEVYLEQLLDVDPDAHYMVRGRLGVAQMRQGKYGPALENLRAVLKHEPRDGALHFAFACIHARLMQSDQALHHLRIAYSELGFGVLAHISDPHLDSLRHTRRFQRIVQSARRQYRQALDTTPAVDETE